MSIEPLLSDITIPLLLLAFLVAFGFANGLMKRKVLLPPGPRDVPMLGSILGFDANSPWVTYMEWSTVHGDLVYSRLLNREIITINSETVANDLLERHSNIYSDRPQYITNDIYAKYISYWSIFLKHPKNILNIYKRKYHGVGVLSMFTMVHFRLAASAVMEVTYGYDSAPRHDALVEAVERSTNILAKALNPEGAAILGALPFLRHIPAWFPGASFKRKTLECQQLTVGVVKNPFQYTKQSIAASTAKLSMVSDLLSRTEQGDYHQELAIKHASASAFAALHLLICNFPMAASETSSSTLNVLMLAMFLHPDVQRKAQLEIDSIIGRDRLPDFSDRPSLPYVEAVFRETLRWRPVAPPLGYFIPKAGAVVIPNIWAMTHNEDKYPDSINFKLERFSPDGKLSHDNVGFIFGFGRRVCVGPHIADASLWASFVSILVTFSKDKQSNEIEVTPKWTVGITTDEPQEAVAND
ncbi:hypothetical protein SERLA73DRAFT_153424 [Serpula lacrymans var. lacrymans S7.3]|uniref:Cytochrome P450 n=1 Tax=Serpula lacrymans var. lacrymans (strain S7.3) TaxID=936435 RepID=F8PZI9_SERL3|nr:hypothetical protein SERLA73DRAFT_153424 [Serpula lacrymans var. lacrymans S7.3]